MKLLVFPNWSYICLFLDPADCQYVESESSDAALLTVAYVMAGVCVLCLLPISVLLIQASLKKKRANNTSNNNNALQKTSSQTKLSDSFQSDKYDGSS